MSELGLYYDSATKRWYLYSNCCLKDFSRRGDATKHQKCPTYQHLEEVHLCAEEVKAMAALHAPRPPGLEVRSLTCLQNQALNTHPLLG
jgi:hypothetical protein